MKSIYFLLTRTDTVPARVIRAFKGGRFSHTSLALTPEMNHLYSYARRRLHNFFIAGIRVEDIHKDIFALYPDCDSALYEITVSDSAYEKVKAEIERYYSNYNKAKYNFLGTIPLAMGIKIQRKYKLTCSQFVALMLDATGEIELPKDPYLMLPNDFMSISGIRKVYEGPLKDCHVPELEPVHIKN